MLREFLLADARQRGAGTIVTFGVTGSHHVCRTAWHARRLGMNTVGVVVHQPAAPYVRSNLLLGIEADAEYVPTGYALLAPRLALQFLKRRHWRDECPPYYAPSGGTSPLSCLGHVNAALELKQQIDAGDLPEPDYLYVALGSLGTAAGLAVGCRLAGLQTRLVGVVAFHRWYCTPGRWASVARRVLRFMRRHDSSVPDVRIDKSALHVVGTALGQGYARPTEGAVRLIQEMRATERIELDVTYTAKALDGAMRYIREHRLHDRTHLFWHTYQPAAPAAQNVTTSLPRGLRRYFVEASGMTRRPAG